MRLLLTIVLAAIAVGACGKREQQPGVATVSETGTAGDTLQTPPPINADSIQSLIAATNWDDTPGRKYTGPVRCGSAPNCGGKSAVTFRIRPRKNAHTIAHERVFAGQDPEEYIAEIKNTDTVPYDLWKIGAGDSAYLKVGVINGQPRYAIYKIDASGNQTLLVTALAGAKCDHKSHSSPKVWAYEPPHCKSASDRVVLYGTPFSAAAGSNATGAKLASNSFAPANLLQAFDAGLWITCTGGCCEGSNWQ